MSHAGRGGTVLLEPSPQLVSESRQAVVRFFEHHFGLVR